MRWCENASSYANAGIDDNAYQASNFQCVPCESLLRGEGGAVAA